MKTKSRYNSIYLIELKRILVQHIHSNLKDYLILSIIFVIGVMLGVIMINNSNEESKKEISGYINGFVDTIKSDNYEVDRGKLTKLSIIQNLKIVAIIWVAGSTIVGIPLIYIITCYKGFRIGYTISAIISSLGLGRRNCFFTCFFVFTEYNCNTNNFNAQC